MQSTRAGIRERSVQRADVREPDLPSRGEKSETVEAKKHEEPAGCAQDRLETLRLWCLGVDEKMKMCTAGEGMGRRQHRPAAACISGEGWDVGTAGVKRVPECRLGA